VVSSARRRHHPTEKIAKARDKVRVCARARIVGVVFWDRPHNVTGRAPSSIELHPILDFACLSLTTWAERTPSAYAARSRLATPRDQGEREAPQVVTRPVPACEPIEDTYFRWLKRTDDQLRAAFDVYDEANGHGLGTRKAASGYADERT
jgi:hypothetical protein